MTRIDHFAVANMLPWLPAEPIGSFRRAYHPTAHVIGPHLTVVFPVPVSVGRDAFVEHVRSVVSGTPSFDIRLSGLGTTWDHWLYLDLAEGRDEVIALHDALYTGILREHLWTEQPYVPHVGLGLFVDEPDTHDLLALRPRSLDRVRLEHAMHEAEAMGLDATGPIDRVHVLGLDEGLTRVTRLEEVALRDRESRPAGAPTGPSR